MIEKVLITGAGGFVGANLVRRTIAEYPDVKVHLFLKDTTNAWRISDVLRRVIVHRVDLEDGYVVRKAVRKIQPDVIFHLATYGAYSSQNELERAVRTNILGTVNLMMATEEVNYRVFVNTGSSSEYGFKSQPMREADLLEPNSYYAATKASATIMGLACGNLENKPIITLRLFSVYGAYEDSTRFIPTAVLNALHDRDINVVKGSMRDFVYIDDVCDAYIACINLKKFDKRIFNICTGKQVSIDTTARLIKRLTKSKSRVNVGEFKQRFWDTNYWVGDNELAKNVLGWQPSHSLRQGLEKTIRWFGVNGDLYNLIR